MTYSEQTLKKLFALAGNECAFPGCTAPIVDTEHGVVTGHICHIKGKNPKGPRYDESQTQAERNDYANLLIMCAPHNKIVDDQETRDQFSVELLIQIKTNHESRNHNTVVKEDLLDKLVRLFEQRRTISDTHAVSEFKLHTDRALKSSKILIPGKSDPIVRPEVKITEDQLRLKTPVVLTGEAGSGKTGIGRILISAARMGEKETLLLDARRVEHVRNESELRQHLSLTRPVAEEIGRIGSDKGFRLLIDQLDNAVGLPSARVLTELAIDCSTLPGVEVVVISRNREGHESKLLSELTAAGFSELESRQLDQATASSLLAELNIPTTEQLTKLAQNLLNLELIAQIKLENVSFDFSTIVDEINLWEKYIDALAERESTGSGGYPSEGILAEAVRLARQALNSDEGSFVLGLPLSRSTIRLGSWGIIVNEHDLVYRFGHDKLQDYFYAWEATKRAAMPRDIIREINPHRTSSVLEWMKRIYFHHATHLYEKFLKEAWGVTS